MKWFRRKPKPDRLPLVRVDDIFAYAQDDMLYELGASFHCPASGCRPWFVPMPDPTIGALTAAAREHVDAHHRASPGGDAT